MPIFRTVSEKIKKLYDISAIQVSKKRRRKLRPVDKSVEKRSIQTRHTLVYTERSPDFCNRQDNLGIPGVEGEGITP